jgi:ADP-dependent NAD(P)H-hydrate dehydratase / NAD(P)H-hydrate epimerase
MPAVPRRRAATLPAAEDLFSVKLLAAAQSRELDRLSQEKYGVPSYSLMTRAGEAVADAVECGWSDALGSGVLVVAGKGNNGGDGMVAARKLKDDGLRVQVLLLGARTDLKGDAARAHADFLAHGGTITEISGEDALETALADHPGAVIDAIFGTGLNAEVTGLPRRAIDLINALSVPVAAVDIASGVNADTGAVMGVGVKASLTVTFGYAKFGHVSYPGAEFCGRLEAVDIGFAHGAMDEIAPRGRFLEAGDVRPLVRLRPANSHKGTYGHTLIIAAGRGKSGAALLASRGALRMGAGLVTAAIPGSVAAIVAAGQAELMTEPMPDRDGHFDFERTPAVLTGIIDGKDAVVVGPGIGVSEETKRLISWLVTEGSAPNRPLLIDADGLNVLAATGLEIIKKARGPIVLTPHPGEMARLLGTDTAAVNADRISSARRLCERTSACVLLKGARSVVAGHDGEVYVNSSGNPGMATAGMGDALSGMIGALLGQRVPPLEALALGVFIHGYAADRLAGRLGPVGYLTGDVIDELPAALSALVLKTPATNF